MDYEKLCKKKVMDLEPKVRFAELINDKARLFADVMIEGIRSLETQKDDEMLHMELVLRAK